MVYISLQAPCPLSASTDHRKLYCGFLLPPKGDCNRIGRLTALRGQRKTGRLGARRLSARLGSYSTAILKSGCEPQFSRRVRGYSAAFVMAPTVPVCALGHLPRRGRQDHTAPAGHTQAPPEGEARARRSAGRGSNLLPPLGGKWPKADRSCFPLGESSLRPIDLASPSGGSAAKRR